MKSSLVPSIVIASLLSGAALSMSTPAQAADVNDAKFLCGTSKSVPATVALTSRGAVPVILWSSQYFNSAGFTPQYRCKVVSARFQQYYKNGMLNYLTTSRLNRQPVVCVATAKGGPCAGVLFTLKPGSDPWLTLTRLMQVRVGASGPLNESTSSPAPMAALAQDGYVDMKAYLNSAPIEVIPVPKTDPADAQPGASSGSPQPGVGLW
jgi:hypothetical protein